MMVSVVMVTYNQERYIEEAINGVLMQETTFDIELIVSNDRSPDGTDTIVQRILKEHPRAACIKYFNHERNLGMMKNFAFALSKCAGTYIALCDGDDYWTEPCKLEKQVSFLEQNADYVCCFHNLKIVYDYPKQGNEKIMFADKSGDFVTEDIIREKYNGCASVLFKAQYLYPRPDWFIKILNGDTAVMLILSTKGKIRYINEVWGVHRKNLKSITSTSWFNDLNYAIHMRKYYNYIDDFLNFKFVVATNEMRIRHLIYPLMRTNKSKLVFWKYKTLEYYYNLCISFYLKFGIVLNKFLNL